MTRRVRGPALPLLRGPADPALAAGCTGFGGYGASGYGGEMGHANLDAYLEVKSVWTDLGGS